MDNSQASVLLKLIGRSVRCENKSVYQRWMVHSEQKSVFNIIITYNNEMKWISVHCSWITNLINAKCLQTTQLYANYKISGWSKFSYKGERGVENLYQIMFEYAIIFCSFGISQVQLCPLQHFLQISLARKLPVSTRSG